MDEPAIARIRPLGVVDEFRSVPSVQNVFEGDTKDTYLIVSDGVTAKTASIIPAPRPAVRTVRNALSARARPTHLRGSGAQ